MGRRARARSTASRATAAGRQRPASAPETGGRRREGALDRLSPVRKVLARFIGLALAVAIATVAGIAGLGGTLGPLIVFAYTVVAAGLIFRWAQSRLAGHAMADEDRMMQTLAGGLLVMSVVLATVSAIVLTLA